MTSYNDGNWHGWNGGECPVHPKSIGDITYADGVVYKSVKLGQYDWNFPLMFRVVKEYREPREFWIAGRNDLAFPSAREAKTAFPGSTPIHVREVTE